VSNPSKVKPQRIRLKKISIIQTRGRIKSSNTFLIQKMILSSSLLLRMDQLQSQL